MTTHTVCRVEELPVGQHRPFTAGDTKLIVYHLEDGFYATQASCTHIFAPLAKGKIVANCQIQCPFHRARFDIRTGKVIEWANWPPGLVNVLNAVRGEDSLVRALWAGRPLIWQIYPQDDGAHHAKLEAFLDWLDAPASLRQFHRTWNGIADTAGARSPSTPELNAWDACARAARERLFTQDDLATQLLGFVGKKR